jgi:molybdate transport system substrate-binding protein
MVRWRIRLGAAVAAVALAVAGCGGERSGGSSASPGEIKVFAAASLTAAFTELGQRYTAANGGTKVTFNFAGSQALATQIQQGAPART